MSGPSPDVTSHHVMLSILFLYTSQAGPAEFLLLFCISKLHHCPVLVYPIHVSVILSPWSETSAADLWVLCQTAGQGPLPIH